MPRIITHPSMTKAAVRHMDDGARIRKTRNCKDLRKLSDHILSWTPQALRDPGSVARRGKSLHQIHAAGYSDS